MKIIGAIVLVALLVLGVAAILVGHDTLGRVIESLKAIIEQVAERRLVTLDGMLREIAESLLQDTKTLSAVIAQREKMEEEKKSLEDKLKVVEDARSFAEQELKELYFMYEEGIYEYEGNTYTRDEFEDLLQNKSIDLKRLEGEASYLEESLSIVNAHIKEMEKKIKELEQKIRANRFEVKKLKDRVELNKLKRRIKSEEDLLVDIGVGKESTTQKIQEMKKRLREEEIYLDSKERLLKDRTTTDLKEKIKKKQLLKELKERFQNVQ